MESIPIGSMYGIYANIGGILMGSMLPYIACMDPMGLLRTDVPTSPISVSFALFACLLFAASLLRLLEVHRRIV